VRSNRGRIEAGVRAEPGGFQPVTLTARGQLAAGEPPERSQLFHSSSADIFLLVFITRQLIRCVCGFHSSFFFSVCVVGGNRPWLWFDSPLPSWVGTSLICILTLRRENSWALLLLLLLLLLLRWTEMMSSVSLLPRPIGIGESRGNVTMVL